MIKNLVPIKAKTAGGNISVVGIVDPIDIGPNVFDTSALPLFGANYLEPDPLSSNAYLAVVKDYGMLPAGWYFGQYREIWWNYTSRQNVAFSCEVRMNVKDVTFGYPELMIACKYKPFKISNIRLYALNAAGPNILEIVPRIDTFETSFDQVKMQGYTLTEYFKPNQAKFRNTNNPFINIPCDFIVNGGNGFNLVLDRLAAAKFVIEIQGNFCEV